MHHVANTAPPVTVSSYDNHISLSTLRCRVLTLDFSFFILSRHSISNAPRGFTTGMPRLPHILEAAAYKMAQRHPPVIHYPNVEIDRRLATATYFLRKKSLREQFLPGKENAVGFSIVSYSSPKIGVTQWSFVSASGYYITTQLESGLPTWSPSGHTSPSRLP